MDANVMEIRLRQWIPIFEEQEKSGLNKREWCTQNGIKRAAFFKWQRECRKYLLEKNAEINTKKKDTFVPAVREPTFVEISNSRIAKAPPSIQAGHEYVQNDFSLSSSLNINYGGFSVALTGTVDEKQLSKSSYKLRLSVVGSLKSSTHLK